MDGYEVLERIGEGGLGVVYRARGPRGPVAVKRLKSPAPRASERFRREARLLAELQESDGIVPLLDAGHDEHGPFLVMPLLEGGTLAQRLRDGRLDPAQAVSLGITLGRALGQAHALGVVHRDLKPANILFTAAGAPRLADFGLAKHFAGRETAGLSRTGDLRGTVGYMAPEQIEDASRAGPPADVFALGLVLLECLSGRPVYTGETPLRVLDEIAAHDPPPLRRLCPDAPTWLEQVLRRATARDPGDRYPNGLTLAAALQGGARLRPPRPPLPRWALSSASALILLSAAVFLAAWLAPVRPEPPASPGLSQRPAQAAAPASAAPVATPQLTLAETWDGPGGSIVGLTWTLLEDKLALHAAGAEGGAVGWAPGSSGQLRAGLAKAQPVDMAEGGAGPLSAFDVDPRGYGYAAGQGTELRLWSPGREQPWTLGPHQSSIHTVLHLGPVGRYLLSADDGGQLVVWDFARRVGAEGRLKALFGVKPKDLSGRVVSGAQREPGRIRLLYQNRFRQLYVFDYPEEQASYITQPLSAPLVSACFSQDGKRALASLEDGRLLAFELGPARRPVWQRSAAAHAQGVVCALSRDGTRAASAGRAGELKVWSLGSAGLEVLAEGRLPDPGDVPTTLRFSPDGLQLAAGTRGGRVHRFLR